MAPSRRKGSGRAATAAAAAAARRQWKVGDLVLAKMKGFPAWPAVVSDPKKWGYSSNRKKLLVFFFGTKQIAFCNHVDLEAFTEERKKLLSTKRHGKGADFVRAVEEIIDCYEKLQKKFHPVTSTSGDGQIISNAGKLEGSDSKHLADSEDSVQPSHSSQPHNHDSPVQDKDPFNSDANSIAPIDDDDRNLNADLRHMADNVSIIDQLRQTPFAFSTSLGEKNKKSTCSNMRYTEKVPLRSKSSKRIDSSNIENVELFVSEDDPATTASAADNVEQHEFVEGNMLPKSISNDAIYDYTDRHMSTDTLVSDGTRENAGFEITRVEPKDVFFQKDAFQTKCEDVHSMNAQHSIDVQICARDTMDDEKSILVLKNNKKINTKESFESTLVYGGKEEGIDAYNDINDNNFRPHYSCKKKNDRISNGDGDEHLPLVKRARARKGDLYLEEKSSEIVGMKPEILSSEFCNKDNTTVTKAQNTGSISSSNDRIKLKDSDMHLKVQSFHLRGITVDAESALPPSKRLHRALEAMSANAAAAEDALKAPCVPDISHKSSNLLEVVSYDTSNSTLKMEREFICEKLILNLPPRSHSCPLNETEELSREMILDKNDSLVNTSSQNGEMLDTIYRSPMSSASAKTIQKEDIETSQPNLTDNCETQTRDHTSVISEKSLPISGGESELLEEKNHCFDDTGKDQFASIEVNKVDEEGKSFLPDTQKIKDENYSALILNDTPVSIEVASVVASGSIKSSSSPSKEKHGKGDMKQYTAEIKYSRTPKDLVCSPDSTPMKILIAAAQAKRFYSRSSSLSDSVIDTKPTSDGMSSLSPFHTEYSSERLSGNSEKNNFQHSCSRSPDGNFHHKKSINGSRLESLSLRECKDSNMIPGLEASAALRSFEALVCTLTRAKDSISRATHYAIECAKHDVAGEVVDSMVKHLEKESSLHRKVDLFFLVDSITRFCRGQKGVAGDVYPSLFQSVLGRLLSAAAPPGNAAWENRKQCLKVLRLWLERKTLSETVVRHHIRTVESVGEGSIANGFPRRPTRSERALDDPVREMEGMLVDEYGSNTSFQLPGLLNSDALKDVGGSDSDDKSFEAVTPEHDPNANGDSGLSNQLTTEKHKHILEDVDGELEMEDVAPPAETEIDSSHIAFEVDAQCAAQHLKIPFAPPLPENRPPTPPPLPSSPPPEILSCHSPSTLPLLPTSNIPADITNAHSYKGINKNVQDHLPHPNTRLVEQSTNSIFSDATQHFAPGHKDFSNNLLPSSRVGSCIYQSNTSSQMSMNQGIASLPLSSESSTNKGYHLQPPPPTISDQFSYVQSERQQLQHWPKCSSSHSEQFVQLGNGQQVGNLSGDGRGIQNENCVFSATVPSGHMHPEKIEVSSSSSAYHGPHPESSSMPNHCWSQPRRPPNYQFPVPPSRPFENHLVRMNAAPGYWRPK